MIQVSISQNLKQHCPDLSFGIIHCNIKNGESNAELWEEIEKASQHLKGQYTLENIKQQPQIFATRAIYKKAGKDPNRYRPSAEALCRRILRDLPLYRISMAVDVINLLSIETGFSIGGFDADKVLGSVNADIGIANEPFEAIGRGELNIEGLPILRDEIGAIGTPTSDVVRTSLQLHSKKLYMHINSYTGKTSLAPAMKRAIGLVEKYLFATDIESNIIT